MRRSPMGEESRPFRGPEPRPNRQNAPRSDPHLRRDAARYRFRARLSDTRGRSPPEVTDLFEEVEEQLRSDRYKQFAQKALPWMLGIAAVVLVAFLGYWGYDSYRNTQVAKASEQYSAAMDAFVAGDRAKAQQLWTEVSKSDAKAYKALGLMHLGAFALEAKKP